MRKANELAQQTAQSITTKDSSASPTATLEPLPNRIVVQLFAKFQARYGTRWTTNHPTDEIQRVAVAEWADGLAGLTPQQLRDGLNAWDGDWPPSLPEFRRACTGFVPPSSNEEWQALGERMGCYAKAGESWPAYINRVKRMIRDPRRLNPDLVLPEPDAQDLLGDNREADDGKLLP